jgi:hypothetical protein
VSLSSCLNEFSYHAIVSSPCEHAPGRELSVTTQQPVIVSGFDPYDEAVKDKAAAILTLTPLEEEDECFIEDSGLGKRMKRKNTSSEPQENVIHFYALKERKLEQILQAVSQNREWQMRGMRMVFDNGCRKRSEDLIATAPTLQLFSCLGCSLFKGNGARHEVPVVIMGG